MGAFRFFHWLVVLAIILLSFFGKRIFRPPGEGSRNRPPTNPVPVTGPVETSRRPKSPQGHPKP